MAYYAGPNDDCLADTYSVTITAEELAPRIGGEDDLDTVEALLAVASERVNREAPCAPESVQNQAVIRYAGYLAQADFGTIRQENIGPRDVQYVVNHQRAWINCGAKSLLAPWKPLRAARIQHEAEA